MNSIVSAKGRTRHVIMRQTWRDLLFVHWAVDPAVIQARLPAGLWVDTFEDCAYLGVVAFRMCDIRIGPLPPVPGLSSLNEINLRTYVRDSRERQGVFFYSLDATMRLAVWIARTCFHLPYLVSDVQYAYEQTQKRRTYTARRSTAARQDTFVYTHADSTREATPGSLDHFLVERYSFYTPRGRSNKLIRGRLTHRPYALADTTLTHHTRHVFSLNGFAEPRGEPDCVTSSPGVDVSIYPLESV